MRYENWDVLLFSLSSNVPIQEFQTSCHVVPDQDYHFAHNGMLLVPTVVSFVPSLSPGAPFCVSVLAWEDPVPSRYSMEYSQHPELIIFEIRIIIDGKLASVQLCDRTGPWSQRIDTTVTGGETSSEASMLQFPVFHPEILTQRWSPGDEFGRIKVTISEGFRRSSESNPFEHINTVVAFSFSHAPREVLEGSAIAWPNPRMWREISALPTSSPGTSPSRLQRQQMHYHGHSSRHEAHVTGEPIKILGEMSPAKSYDSVCPRDQTVQGLLMESTVERSYDRKASSNHSNDVSMPDYSSYTASIDGGSRNVSIVTTNDERRNINTDPLNAEIYIYNSAAKPPPNASPDLKSGGSRPLCSDHAPKAAMKACLPRKADSPYAPGTLMQTALKARKNKQSDSKISKTQIHASKPSPVVKSRKENFLKSLSPTKPEPEVGIEEFCQPRSAPNIPNIDFAGSNQRQRDLESPIARGTTEEDELGEASSPCKDKGVKQKANMRVCTLDATGERRALSGISQNVL